MTRTIGRRLIWILVVLMVATAPLVAVDVHVDEELDTEGASIQDDYLFLGKELTFTGSAHSLYFLGQDLEVSGSTRDSIFAMAGSLDIDGSIGEDAVLAARSVDLTGVFGSTTFAAGNTVDLADGAQVGGGLFAAGRRVEIAGQVDGDL